MCYEYLLPIFERISLSKSFPYIDLLPELQAVSNANPQLSPHEVARKFILEESARRGGVEVIVATDKNGKFLGAGTANCPYFIEFPPSINSLLDDPSANLVLHHNHPPQQNQFFSAPEDMGGLSQHRGIGWMLMHTEQAYSAMRITDRMFQTDLSGSAPKNGLVSAYKFGQLIAGFEMHDKLAVRSSSDVLETAPAELCLRALQEVGAIHYHSNIQTGLPHDHERFLIQQIRQQSSIDGSPIWATAQEPITAAAPGGVATAGSPNKLSVTPPVTIEFNRFVDFISGQHPFATDARISGRPQSAELPETGGKGSGLASGGPTRGSFLEPRLRGPKAQPA